MQRPRAFQTLIDPLLPRASCIIVLDMVWQLITQCEVDQSKGFSVTGSHKRPLGGVLSSSVGLVIPTGSNALRYQIAEGTKMLPARPDEFDVQKDDDAIANNTRAVIVFIMVVGCHLISLLDPKSHIGLGTP